MQGDFKVKEILLAFNIKETKIKPNLDNWFKTRFNLWRIFEKIGLHKFLAQFFIIIYKSIVFISTANNVREKCCFSI